jgi:hypothetical protein
VIDLADILDVELDRVARSDLAGIAVERVLDRSDLDRARW